ncbi:MAG: DNA-directed RNA polymerase subunit omega [Firmicutes bacterium]|nr:DNA-directed RNA polymerase subunit omega [Bacillota bacterium]MBQ3199872.1 DNA-directed RNA polymerase subunit omega [Bacillota bacterium]
MNKPYIDSITTKSDSKYELIVAAAKRARQITLDEPDLTRSGKINPVSQALKEIDEDIVTWDTESED